MFAAQTGKHLPAVWETGVLSLAQEEPWRRERGAWWATVHGVAESRTWLTTNTPIHNVYRCFLDTRHHSKWFTVNHLNRVLCWTSVTFIKEETDIWKLNNMSSFNGRNGVWIYIVWFLEKEMATHSSVLAWRIPGMGEPGGLPSTGSHRVRHDWSDLAAAAAVWF